MYESSFVDVEWGDGAIFEPPEGRLIKLDAGEVKNLKDYMSASCSYMLKNKELDCGALGVAHGCWSPQWFNEIIECNPR